jgi:3-hydroxyethyl bacteriochlorophyllide a dehydrogenase
VKAQAVVAVDTGRVEYQDISVPDPTDEDVVVRVQHSWISPGTERSMINAERLDGETPRSPSDVLPFPHVPGYQKVGVVEWVGSAVANTKIGETVFATVSKVDGMYYPTGGHVSPAVTHHSQIWGIPNGTNPVALSGMVLAQVGYNCTSRFEVGQGDAVVIVGDGLIGHWAAQTLVAQGARVMLIGKHDQRLHYFEASLNDRVVNISHDDAVTKARSWAPEGVYALIDTIGSVPSIMQFLPYMRHNGHVVSAGFHGAYGLIDIQRLRARELSLHSPSGWSKPRMDRTRDLIAHGVIQTARLITHRFPAHEAEAAYRIILGRVEPFLGIVLDWA